MSKKHKIFFVDDEIINCELFKVNFSEYFDVEIFTEPEVALEAIRSSDVELLITDLKMPGMDGMELIARTNVVDKQIKCIIISGYNEDTDAYGMDESLVARYVEKPFLKNELLHIINQALSS